jgi:hypothetical protein
MAVVYSEAPFYSCWKCLWFCRIGCRIPRSFTPSVPVRDIWLTNSYGVRAVSCVRGSVLLLQIIIVYSQGARGRQTEKPQLSRPIFSNQVQLLVTSTPHKATFVRFNCFECNNTSAPTRTPHRFVPRFQKRTSHNATHVATDETISNHGHFGTNQKGKHAFCMWMRSVMMLQSRTQQNDSH